MSRVMVMILDEHSMLSCEHQGWIEHRQRNLRNPPGDIYDDNMSILPLPDQHEYQVPSQVATRPHGGPDQYLTLGDVL